MTKMKDNGRLEFVEAACNSCDAEVGHYCLNRWKQVTSTCYLPSLLGSFRIDGLRPTNSAPQPAPTGSHLDSCDSLRLRCASCRQVLVVLCTHAPVEKALYRNRDFLTLKRLALISEATGSEVEPIIEDPRVAVNDASMETERSVAPEVAEKQHPMSPPRDVVIRESAPPSASSRTLDSSHAPSLPEHPSGEQQHQEPHPVWTGAISRLQTQASNNTCMLESQQRDVVRLSDAVGRLQHEMGSVFAMLEEVKTELRSRPVFPPAPYREQHDPGDLDILAGQVESAARKANEVDSLRLQVDLMKRRMKRLEEQGSPGHRPGTASSAHQRDSSFYEAAPAPAAPHHHPQHQHQQPPYAQHAPSPVETRPPTYHQPPPAPQAPSNYHRSPEARVLSSKAPPSTESRTLSGVPQSEPQSSAISSWRPAAGYAPPTLQPPSRPPAHPHTLEPEPQASGWAAVNVNQPMKRSHPFDERPSPYQSPAPGSPKRPKLAPLIPRSSYGDDSYTNTPSTYHNTATTATSDMSQMQRSRNPSNDSQSHIYPGSVPTQSTNSYQFVTSTGEAPSEDSWRPESQRPQIGDHHHGRGRGRGRGGGRGRGRRSAGHEPQELGTPEWEKPEWTGSQISPNGYYNPLHPRSPSSATRGGLVRRSGGHAGGPTDREHEVDSPMTPMNMSAHQDRFEMHDGSHSGGKKTRTKPIRNADGILIRKDGRPDMRSVSSANNLRKVHAKKEAERAEMEGRTPTSALSLAPATNSDDAEGRSSGTPSTPEDGEPNTQERHRDIMSKVFPRGIENRSVADQFFPRLEDARAPQVKLEAEERERGPQSHDVEMRDGGDARNEQQDDRRMTAEEHAEEEARLKLAREQGSTIKPIEAVQA